MKKSLITRSLMAGLALVILTHCSAFEKRSRKVETRIKDTLFRARAEGEMKKRVIILPFLNQSDYDSQVVVEDARDDFIRELNMLDHTLILDWRNFGLKDLKEFRRGLDYDHKGLAQRLRNSGVHAIVVGVVKRLNTKIKGDSVGIFRRVEAKVDTQAQIRVISVRSGKVMVDETRTADSTGQITKVAERRFTDKERKDDPATIRLIVNEAFRKTIPPLLESLSRFSWEGRVALVRGEQIYLNAGRQSGLQIGDILRIVETQEEVFDPENDRFIGYIKGRMKGTVEVLNYYGKDGAVTRIHSGSGFKENDLVEFY